MCVRNLHKFSGKIYRNALGYICERDLNLGSSRIYRDIDGFAFELEFL